MQISDVCFCYTNCGWMVWHWLISCLAIGSTLVLYDGAPFWPKFDVLWKIITEERVSYFGTSARSAVFPVVVLLTLPHRFLATCNKESLQPGRDFDLSRLKL